MSQVLNIISKKKDLKWLDQQHSLNVFIYKHIYLTYFSFLFQKSLNAGMAYFEGAVFQSA